VDVDVDVARAHAHAGRARAYKLINKTTAFYWNVKAEYWYSSRGLPKICMPASCMLMTDAGTHGERVSASPLASGCQRVVVRSLAPWRLIATWKAHLSILTLALSTRSDHISTPPPPTPFVPHGNRGAAKRSLLRPDRPEYSPTRDYQPNFGDIDGTLGSCAGLFVLPCRGDCLPRSDA